MADCNELFQAFFKTIQLSEAEVTGLKTARDALRSRITGYFQKTKKIPIPKFCGQGSLSMGTIIKPINGEYDIDDGVYLQNLGDEAAYWPDTKTVHAWVVDAVDGHTSTPPIDKQTCVRVIYKKEYHVDLPIYAESRGTNYYAHTRKGWGESKPLDLISWFRSKVEEFGDQFKRMVCFFKAWADYYSKESRFPSGLVLTVLISEYFEKSQNEDICFAELSQKIFQRMLSSTLISNPVDYSENLFEKYSDQKDAFIESLKILSEMSSNALLTRTRKKSCEIWADVFGERWPDCSSLQEPSKPLKTNRSAILKDDGRSA